MTKFELLTSIIELTKKVGPEDFLFELVDYVHELLEEQNELVEQAEQAFEFAESLNEDFEEMQDLVEELNEEIDDLTNENALLAAIVEEQHELLTEILESKML